MAALLQILTDQLLAPRRAEALILTKDIFAFSDTHQKTGVKMLDDRAYRPYHVLNMESLDDQFSSQDFRSRESFPGSHRGCSGSFCGILHIYSRGMETY
jgi:hypothetical protein